MSFYLVTLILLKVISWTGLLVKRPKTLLSCTFWHKSNWHKHVYTFLGHKCTLSRLRRVYRSRQYRILLIKSDVGFWAMNTDMLKEEPNDHIPPPPLDAEEGSVPFHPRLVGLP